MRWLFSPGNELDEIQGCQALAGIAAIAAAIAAAITRAGFAGPFGGKNMVT
jgi:hypothetical protein